MSTSWRTDPKSRDIRGPFPHAVLLEGRFFDQAQYDAQNKKRWEQCVAKRKSEEETQLLRTGLVEQLRDEFIARTDRKYRRARLRDNVDAQLTLHEFSLEDRRDKLRTLLFDDDERYRREAEAMVPTTLDRLADNRQRLKQLRDRKEKERLELVQQKYLQQAALNHEELRTQFRKQLELEAAEDRDAQLRLKREMAEQQRHVDRHYHDLLVADVEARRRREELETMERNRANHIQVRALVEQIAASDNSKANRARRVAEEHRYLTEQLELRREEQRAEREKAELKKRATRDMFARSIEHARQKRDQQRHEEMVCDMKMIEQNLQGLGDEERAIQQRKKELLKEQLQYLDYLDAMRDVEDAKRAEFERLTAADQQEQNEKQLRQERLNAAARRRLLCDVSAVQRQQRDDKAKTTVLSKEDREQNRQMLLDEMEAACQQDTVDKQRQRHKKMECRADLLGQMDYNERRRCEQRAEEARMVERQKQAEQLFNDEIKYLLEHPFDLKTNPRRKQLPDEIKLPCS